MTKVFSVRNDSDRYQTFSTVDQDDWENLMTNGQPRGSGWSPPPVYIQHLERPSSDFYSNNSGTLVATPHATEVLRPFFELAGEILPLPYQGEIYWLLNVTVCVDAIDEEKAEYYVGSTGLKLHLTRYAFDIQRLPHSPLFKLPRNSMAKMFLTEGLRPPDEEFRAVTLREHLVGLRFELLWSDDEESVQ